MQNVTNALLNFLLVSIPEELFLTCMTLIFLKRFDLLDIRMWKQNLKWIMIPVLPVALMINVFRYIIVIPRPFMTIVDFIIFFILTIYILKNNSFEFVKKDYLKTFLFLTLSLIILAILENSTYPSLMFIIDKPYEYFKDNIIWNFILSFPSRILEYFIVLYLIIKQNNIIKIKLFEIFIQNKLYFKILIFLSVTFNFLSIYFIKLIVYDKIIENKGLLEKIFISEALLIFPVVIIFAVLLLVNDLLVKQKQIQQTYENLIIHDDVTTDVENQL